MRYARVVALKEFLNSLPHSSGLKSPRRIVLKIAPYTQAQATHFDSEFAKGITARVVIGKS